jgi:hypothetical protein
MVHFLNFRAYLPFEMGNPDISNPELLALPAGHWDNRVKKCQIFGGFALAALAQAIGADASGKGE